MEITVHKHLIEQCLMMACASKADRDKALWLTMAQSWVRLADEVERSEVVDVLATSSLTDEYGSDHRRKQRDRP